METGKFDPLSFRQVLGTFATGVTIITTRAADDSPIGVTANSFNSVSLDPPLVLWSIAKNAMSLPSFVGTGYWAVHILSADQQELSDRFAKRGGDKFAGLPVQRGVQSIPLLSGCAARLQCRTMYTYDGGDHLILIGEVLAFDRSDLAPLVFHGGKYAVAAQKAAALSISGPASEGSDQAYSENFLGYLLWRAFHQFQQPIRQRVRDAGLSMLEFYTLCALMAQDGRSVAQINAFTRLTGEEVTAATVAALASKEMVRAAAQPAPDAVFLSERGRRVTMELMAGGVSVEAAVLDRLGSQETAFLKNLLKQLIVATNPGLPHPWDSVADQRLVGGSPAPEL